MPELPVEFPSGSYGEPRRARKRKARTLFRSVGCGEAVRVDVEVDGDDGLMRLGVRVLSERGGRRPTVGELVHAAGRVAPQGTVFTVGAVAGVTVTLVEAPPVVVPEAGLSTLAELEAAAECRT